MYQSRKSIRLSNYNYAQAGVYFVTICTHQRQCVFGEVKGDKVQLSALGQLVTDEWQQLPRYYPNLALDTFVIMPNHLHGLLCFKAVEVNRFGSINQKGLMNQTPTETDNNELLGSINQTPTLGEVVRAFKARVTRSAKLTLGIHHALWQRNYYEHIVRGENDLAAIREYIVNNPLQWHLDKENPNA